MKAGWTISAVLHGVILGATLIIFAIKPLNAPPLEFLTTDIISDADFSQITNGIKTAPKAETPKPLVEKIAETKPVEEHNAKVVDKKPEIVATSDKVDPPKPQVEQKKAEPKPPTPAAKSEPKQAFAKEPEPKVDPIAEALKKDTQEAGSEDPAEGGEPPPKKRRAAEAAAEVRREPHRRAARQARSATPLRHRCNAEPDALARHGDRTFGEPDAKRDRRIARAHSAMLESAGRIG